MSGKTLYPPQDFTEEDWQLIARTLRDNPDTRSQELAELLVDWRAEISVAWSQFQRAKMSLRSR